MGNFVFQELPWLRTLLAWLVALVVIFIAWILVSFLAYIITEIIDRARVSAARAASALSNSDRSRFARTREAGSARFSRFLDNHSLLEIRSWDSGIWTDIARRLEELQSRSLSVPTPPDADSIVVENRDSTRAKFALAFSVVVIFAIAIANTGLLSRILQELGIGGFVVAGNIRLYHVLAFFLTLIEAGIGLFGGYIRTDPRRSSNPGLHLAALIPPSFACCLACVEGFFYSRLGQTAETPPIRILGFEFGMPQAFFVLGFILPSTLYALGDIAFASVVHVRTGRGLQGLRRELNRLRRYSQDLSRLAMQVEGRLQHAREEVRKGQAGVPTSYDEVGVRLPREQVTQFAYRTGSYLAITCGVVAFVIYVHARVFPGMYSSFGGVLGGVVGLVKVAALLFAGLLLRPSAAFLSESGTVRPIEAHRLIIPQIAGALLGGGLILADLIWGFVRLERSSYELVWVSMAFGEGALLLLGRYLPHMLALLLALLQSVVEVLGCLIPCLLTVLAYVGAWALMIALFLARLLAAPLTWLLGIRRKRARANPTRVPMPTA